MPTGATSSASWRTCADRPTVSVSICWWSTRGTCTTGTGCRMRRRRMGPFRTRCLRTWTLTCLPLGIHELYVSDIAYEHFYWFPKVFGGRYLTSNVRIKTPNGDYQYIGKQYRYFTTNNGVFNMARNYF